MNIKKTLQQSLLIFSSLILPSISLFLSFENLSSAKSSKKKSVAKKSTKKATQKPQDFPDDMSPADLLAEINNSDDGKKMFAEMCSFVGQDLGIDNNDPDAFLKDMMAEVEALQNDPDKKQAFNDTFKEMEESGAFKDIPGFNKNIFAPMDDVALDQREESFDLWQETSSNKTSNDMMDNDMMDVDVDTDTAINDVKQKPISKISLKKTAAKDWLEILEKPSLPLSKEEKTVFRKDLIAFVIQVKNVSPHITSSYKFSPSHKEQLLLFDSKCTNFATHLYTFYRPLYLRTLLSNENNTTRQSIIKAIKNIVSNITSIEKFNGSFLDEDDHNLDWLENKKARQKLKPSTKEAKLIASVKKSISEIIEITKKCTDILKSPQLEAEIKKKKKLYKVIEKIFEKKHPKYFEAYKEKLNNNYSSDNDYDYDGSYDWPSYSDFKPDTLLSTDKLKPDNSQQNDLKDNPTKDNNPATTTITNQPLKDLLKSKPYTDLIDLSSQINTLNEFAHEKLSEAFFKIDFEHLSKLIAECNNKKPSSKNDDVEEDSESDANQAPKPSRSINHSEIKPHLQKIYKPLFYLSKLPQSITLEQQNIQLVPFYVEKNDNQSLLLANLLSSPSLTEYQSFIKTLQSNNQEQITTISKQLKKILQMPILTPEATVQKTISDSWEKGRQHLVDTAIKAIYDKIATLAATPQDIASIQCASDLQDIANTAIKSALVYPVFDSAQKSTLSLSNQSKNLFKNLATSYNKKITDLLQNNIDQNGSMKTAEDSFEIHRILSSFKEFIESLQGMQTSQSTTNPVEQSLKTLELFKHLWPQTPADIKFTDNSNWIDIFGNLEIMQNFATTKTLLTSDQRQSLTTHTPRDTYAYLPVYLTDWFQGKSESLNKQVYNLYNSCTSLKENPETRGIEPLSNEYLDLINYINNSMIQLLKDATSYEQQILIMLSSLKILQAATYAEKGSFIENLGITTPQTTTTPRIQLLQQAALLIQTLYDYFSDIAKTNQQIIGAYHSMALLCLKYTMDKHINDYEFDSLVKDNARMIDQYTFYLTTRQNQDTGQDKKNLCAQSLYKLFKLIILNNIGKYFNSKQSEENSLNRNFADKLFLQKYPLPIDTTEPLAEEPTHVIPEYQYNQTFITTAGADDHKFNIKAIIEKNEASLLEIIIQTMLLTQPRSDIFQLSQMQNDVFLIEGMDESSLDKINKAIEVALNETLRNASSIDMLSGLATITNQVKNQLSTQLKLNKISLSILEEPIQDQDTTLSLSQAPEVGIDGNEQELAIFSDYPEDDATTVLTDQDEKGLELEEEPYDATAKQAE